MSSQESGRVLRLAVSKGESVNEGQSLFL
ncbi:hypothetical protein NAI35_12100, partial [Francisella tularensis subsp. holarctica]